MLDETLAKANKNMDDVADKIELKSIEIAEYNKDSAISEMNAMRTRLQRSKDQKNQMKQQNAELRIQNDDLHGTVTELKERVRQLEVDGGYLRPLLEEARTNNQDLQHKSQGTFV